MKKHTLLTLLFCFLMILNVRADKTITLQPAACGNDDAVVSYIIPTTNSGNGEDLFLYAWTQGGNLNVNRSFLNFDLSAIPANAVITDAKLSLFYNPTNGPGFANSGNNSFSIFRINSSWLENVITWSNQPGWDNSDSVNVSASTVSTQDYPNIDVTQLVQNMINNPANSFGFVMKLDDENPYNSVMLASGDHSNSALHPKLVITYNDPAGTSNVQFHLQPDATSGNDCPISYIIPSTNSGDDENLFVYAWTQGGNLNINRSFLNFDLTSIPVYAQITDARLSLFYNPTNSPGFTNSGANAFTIYRVTGPWTETAVTWNNQPTTDQITTTSVPASTSGTQDYPNLDVTAIVQAMVNDPANSYGFELRLDNESPYASVMLASSDHPDCSLHPILEVSCQFTSGINDLASNNGIISVYPNPFVNSTRIIFSNQGNRELSLLIRDVTGKVIRNYDQLTGTEIIIPRGNLAAGVYFLSIVSDNQLIGVKKLVVQ